MKTINDLTPAKNNYLNAFMARHEERRDIWGLDDELVNQLVDYMAAEYDFDFSEHDAVLDYDNLAINAEIVNLEEAGLTSEEVEDAVIVLDDYAIIQW